MNEYAVKSPSYYGERTEMLQFIPADARRLLDVGCGTGLFSKNLKLRQESDVWGIEIDMDAAEKAGVILDHVVCGDILSSLDKIPDNYFDVIIFNDVLEHLYDPSGILKLMKNKLSVNGIIVASIPNVRHYKLLLKLVFKKEWRYESEGTLDWTHIRFFTRRSIEEMFSDCGYDVKKIVGLNRSKHPMLHIINLFSVGMLSDTLNLQYAVVAAPEGTRTTGND